MKKSLIVKLNDSKRNLIAAILLFVLMLSISSVVYASSYTTTVSFKNNYSGKTREFNGQNIMYSATMSSSKSNDSGTYTVALDRASGIWAFEVGSKTLKRVGYGEAKWSNVGSGEYRLSFYKSSDGVELSSKNVVIKNY